jgi:hypothetical protein
MIGVEARQVATVAGLLAVAAYVGYLMWLLQHGTYDEWGAMVIGPVLVLVSLPILARVAAATGHEWFFGVAVTALVLKLLASLARYWVAFILYGGVADASGYDGAGARLAASYRHGVFELPTGSAGAGTHFIQVVTGIVYAVTGPTLIGGYLVFSWLGFWGLLLFYRAFQIAVPTGEHRRYALMVFFLPSLLFWPSGLGKEAWMTMGLGLCAYGVARLLNQGVAPGLAALTLGMLATAGVRPHVTLLVAGAVVIAFAVRRSRQVTPLTPVVKVVGTLALLAVTYVVLQKTASFLGVDDSVSGFDGALQQVQSRTATGGSQFAGAAITSPLGLPWAVVTVIFRPFPWEADNPQALAASVEGVLLVYLTWRFRRSLYVIPRLLRSTPYVTYSLAYLSAYIVAFSGFSNFGILVRERTLALPAFLVLLALAGLRPAAQPPHAGRREMALR